MPEQRLREQWRDILLELLLAIGHELDVDAQLQKFLPVFLRKLSCQAVGVFEADPVFYQDFNLVKQMPRNANLAMYSNELSNLQLKDGEILATDPQGSVYAFELTGFGYLCLKHQNLSDIFRYEMRQLCLRLSYTLRACRQHQLLQRSQRELDQFFELSDNFMCMLNQRGYLIKVNPAFVMKLGYSLDELYATPFIEFVHPDDQPLTIEYFNGLFAENSSVTFKNRIMHKQGHCLDFSWDIAVQSTTAMVYATAMDITLQVEIERNLLRAKNTAEQTAQAKAAFLANMSHEIRTPLNGVLGMLDLVLQQPIDIKVKSQLETAMQSGKSLLAIVNDVLDFSKMSAGKLKLEAINFDAVALFKDVIDAFQYLANEKQLLLKLNLANLQHLWLIGDPHRIKQILNNLLGNALKFTEKGQVELTVSSEATNEGIQLTIAVVDTGIGLNKTQQQHMFEAFSQADVSTTRRFGGTGLGLTICKELATLMAGDIRVHSVRGLGSVFTVTLQLRQGHYQESAATPSLSLDATQLAGLRVLLVEDNPINRQIAVAMLENLAIQVETAEHGGVALELLKGAAAGDFAAVIMDCLMPEMDGYAATGLIRQGIAGEDWREIPILALTANAMSDDRKRCLDAGMDAYLSKPFTLEQLQQQLLELLQATVPANTVSTSQTPLTTYTQSQSTLQSPAQNSTQSPTQSLENAAPSKETAVSATASVIFDSMVHAKNLQGMEHCRTQLLTLFAEQVPTMLTAMQAAFAASEQKKIALLAHSLKSSAAQLGFMALSQAAKTLEYAAKQSEPADYSALIAKLQDCAEFSLAELNTLLM